MSDESRPTKDLLIRSSIKLQMQRDRLNKNASKMLQLPSETHSLNKLDLSLSKSKNEDRKIKLKYALKSLNITPVDRRPKAVSALEDQFMDFEQIRQASAEPVTTVKNSTVLGSLKEAMQQKLAVKQEDEENSFDEHTNLDDYLDKHTGKNVVVLHKRKVEKPQINSTNMLQSSYYKQKRHLTDGFLGAKGL